MVSYSMKDLTRAEAQDKGPTFLMCYDSFMAAEQRRAALRDAFEALKELSVPHDPTTYEELALTEEEELGLGKQRRDHRGENGMQASDVPEVAEPDTAI